MNIYIYKKDLSNAVKLASGSFIVVSSCKTYLFVFLFIYFLNVYFYLFF